MGCGASTQEVTAIDAPVTINTDKHGVSNVEKGTTRTNNAKQSLQIAEADAIKAIKGATKVIKAIAPEDLEKVEL